MKTLLAKSRRTLACLGLVLAALCGLNQVQAQVTTSSITGQVSDAKGEGLPGASIVAIHIPSGSRYGTVTNNAGRYTLPAVRVGGPYRVTVTFVGYKEKSEEGLYANLGTAANLDITLSDESQQLSEVVVSGARSDIFSSERTGAATTVSKDVLAALPTIGRTINDFTRLTPQGNGRSFGGQDSRLNNITIDGAVFNNGFGLGDQPGARTSVAPISLDAIEEVQVNVAPFDVRQTGFTGAGVNAVTRSGTNQVSGSAFYLWRNEGPAYLGREARGEKIAINQFNKSVYGFRLGGPIIKDKLFFFVNAELEKRVDPGTSFLAKRAGLSGANVTRVEASDLDAVSQIMNDKFGINTGPYENYNLNTKGDKYLARFDWNINNNHKFNFRVSYLKSNSEQNISNSNSIGLGNRRTLQTAMSYKNSGYIINEDYLSMIGELNSTLMNGKAANNLIIGYTNNNEDRSYLAPAFPTIDILNNSNTYISVGTDPFTPYNLLRYNTFQFIDNFTYFAGKHTLTAGISVERFTSDNSFYSAALGSYVFNSLDDFKTAMNAYTPGQVIVPGSTVSPVAVNLFQYRYSLQGNSLPLQQLKVFYPGIYIQDDFQVRPNFKLTAGLRADIPFFGKTGFENSVVAGYTFRDENGAAVQYNTAKLPDARPLWSPRVGFNWDVKNDRTTQIRGGSGIFTGRPPYVWISNQIGNNGVLSGLVEARGTTAYPFTTDPSVYKPTSQTGRVTYDINVTDPKYKFPQVWKTNLAVDQKLPLGMILTLEGVYNKNVNATYYIDANRESATGTFTGPDNRPRFPGSGLTGSALTNAIRINDDVVNNLVLKNTNKGYAYTLTAKLEKPFTKGFYAMAAYTYGEAKDLGSPGSTAVTSYTNLISSRGSNYVDLTYSDQEQRHRVIGSASYKINYGGQFGGSSQISLFYEARNQGRYSYVYGGDMNGDGLSNNDILYVPNSANELKFATVSGGSGATAYSFSADQQVAAFERYINQDPYLSKHRGQYIQRNAGIRPWVYTMDLSFVQEFYLKAGKNRNTLQFRVDVTNFGNLLNNKWGVGYTQVNNRPLSFASVDANGQPVFRMATQTKNNQTVLLEDSFISSLSTNDVWNAQFGVRYIFN
ncbi:TonB-dependent receptor [Siphonobacter curvatus]|uniref:TonB-dependent receptor n=1 Tax=Siphonobacter curvatus TaxID=2094562 RepID=UPI001FAEB270|nr:carboxypeptidase regulatory-like domain-containing protein [Siphonobacter curvatus]